MLQIYKDQSDHSVYSYAIQPTPGVFHWKSLDNSQFEH
jgi:hypothetical protein